MMYFTRCVGGRAVLRQWANHWVAAGVCTDQLCAEQVATVPAYVSDWWL